MNLPNPLLSPQHNPMKPALLVRKVGRETDTQRSPCLLRAVFTAKECERGAQGKRATLLLLPCGRHRHRAVPKPGPGRLRPRLGSKFSGPVCKEQALGRCWELVFLEHTCGKGRPAGEAHETDLAGPTNTKIGSFHQETCPLTSGLEERGLLLRRGSERAAWDSSALRGPDRSQQNQTPIGHPPHS